MSRPHTYNTTVIAPYGQQPVSPLDPDTIYLYVNDDGEWKLIHFLCPCGCGKEFELSAFPGCRNPVACWSVTVENEGGRVTLSPSVHYKAGCQSHFNIRDGAVAWI